MKADPQCAARTQLWNLHARDWDADLLELFGLPAETCRGACPPATVRDDARGRAHGAVVR